LEAVALILRASGRVELLHAYCRCHSCRIQESTSILDRMRMGLDVKAERALLLFFLEAEVVVMYQSPAILLPKHP
jgi:hypothetical protein